MSKLLASLRSTTTSAGAAPSLAAAVLAVAVAVEGLGAVRSFVRRSAPVPAPIGTLPVSRPQFEQLIATHLFGAPPAQASAEAPPSQGPLKLVGTIAFADPKLGFALIGDGGQGSRLYRADGVLPGGAILREIYALKVVIERDGVRETLLLPSALLGKGAVVDERPTSVIQTHKQRAQLPPSAIKLPPQANIVHPTIVMTAKSPFLRAVHPTPLVIDGHLLGYRIAPNVARALPGIAPENLILAINGRRLEDGASAAAAFQSLSEGNVAIITVLTADGGSRDLTVPTSGLGALVAPGRPR